MLLNYLSVFRRQDYQYATYVKRVPWSIIEAAKIYGVSLLQTIFLIVVPVSIVYLFFQKQLIQGMTAGAVKGEG
jgi:ABC-type glycerol-3-phosphate transport system permease component